MGTRSHTIFRESTNSPEQKWGFYQQHNGSPANYGAWLANYLKDTYLVNGFSMDDIQESGRVFNGLGDLGIRLLTDLKNECTDELGHPMGYVSIAYPEDLVPNFMIDYTYELIAHPWDEDKLRRAPVEKYIVVIVYECSEKIFSGDVAQFIQWIDKGDEQ